MPVALISSLYRCERHLPAFSAALFGFAKRVSEAGLAVHYLPIVNDATTGERELVDKLAGQINARYYGRMSPQYVPRESLYASWNRAIEASDAPCFTPWNADDIRRPEALIAGYQALQEGASLVDFPFTRVFTRKRFGRLRQERETAPSPYDPLRFSRVNGLGPFFMASRALYATVGPFDANFRVAGDTEWAARAQPHARFQACDEPGGDFVIHGDNLSNTGGQREDIEVNIIFMRRGEWRFLKPANPIAMRAAWERWGNPAQLRLPPAQADFLWGPGAERRWKRFQAERRQPAPLRRLRLALAARGMLTSVEWSMALRERDRQ